MSTITQTFEALRPQSRLAFMPFITAGDPDVDFTAATLRELSKRSVDLIEIGFPYSDPIADGPVIQSSYTRALSSHLHVDEIFDTVQTLKGTLRPPLIGMVSFALIFRRGVSEFVQRAAKAGFAGLIIPDLPGDEAADVFSTVRAAGLDLIQLIAPTTPPERATQILKCCSGFVYCIAVAGTTGVRENVANALHQQLAWLRKQTSLPLCVGFGISRPEHVESLRGIADGIIVGSRIVGEFEALSDGSATRTQVLDRIGTFAASMVHSCHATP